MHSNPSALQTVGSSIRRAFFQQGVTTMRRTIDLLRETNASIRPIRLLQKYSLRDRL
jgi:hypothetical protein